MPKKTKKTDEIAEQSMELQKKLRKARRAFLDIDPGEYPDDQELQSLNENLTYFDKRHEEAQIKLDEAVQKAEAAINRRVEYREQLAAKEAAFDQIMAAWEEIQELGLED